MWKALAVVGAAAAMLAGCSVPSLNQMYSKDKSDVAAEPTILGTWEEEDRTYRVEPGEAKSYRVTVTSKSRPGETTALEVHLVRVDGALFADVFPAEEEREALAEKFGAMALPAHVIARVEVNGDQMQLWQTEEEELRRAVTGQTGCPHSLYDERTTVLTGTPAQVKACIAAAAKNPEVFRNLVTLKRVAAR